MTDFITPVLDTLTRLCGYCYKWADSIRNLGGKLHYLKKASDDLNSRYLDVKTRVEVAESNPELKVLNEVRNWMCRVQVLQIEVNNILQQGNREIQAKCFGGRCPKNCQARYNLNNKITMKLSDINDLMSQRHDVAEKCARYQFEQLPVDKTMVTQSTYEELCSCFQNDEVGIIGLYGMGGVGKSTLLKKFNNDFLSTKADYMVIYVVASKDADPGKIQDAIMKKLCVQDDNSKGKAKVDDKTRLLYNFLKEKKFVLLLDDVWERIDLLELGVPSPNNHQCKIIFATRSYEVCGLMDAKRRIGVKCLTPDKAFELFKEKVGETTLENPLIRSLAMQVVEECKGLPLALCAVGRAMANKVTAKEWERDLEILRSYPSKIQGVEDVYYALEFSYDRFPKDTYKSCFLYCALFCEDYNIRKEELILLWIAEGFLAVSDYDIHEARKQGEDIISKLKYACLLEDGEQENTVKMHDVIRDMALWVACDHDKKTRFLVNDSSKTSGLQVYTHAKWEEVEKLSLWGNSEIMTNFSKIPHCPNLVTLLIKNDWRPFFPTEEIPTEVFVLPNTIRVLDLSGSGAKNLPSTIGDFVNLQYMNLSYTAIRNLPNELKNLKMLRFLLLDRLGNLVIPEGVISSLLFLQALSMRDTFSKIDENVLLDELEGLGHLQDIRICVCSPPSIKKILISSKLQRCMCELFVGCCSMPQDFFLALGTMVHLESLIVENSKISKETANIVRRSSIQLGYLRLSECHNVLDLNWLNYAPNLEVLELSKCDLLEAVISENIGIVKTNLFSNLSSLHLAYLNNLRSISRMTLQFPSLKEINVRGCPNLKKLPFNSQSALKNLRCCVGDPEWFHQLKWEDQETKNLLSSKFRHNWIMHFAPEKVNEANQHHLSKFG